MVVTSRAHLLARHAAHILFAIAFFPTLAALGYFASPALALAVLTAGTIMFCVMLLVAVVMLIVALVRRQDKRHVGASFWWVSAAQATFATQAFVIYALIQRM